MSVCRLVRRSQRHQLVQGQPQAVDVGPGVALAVEPLGGHVADGADDVAGVGQVVGVGRLGQAEVGDPDVAVSVEQEVGRLDVAMKDALAVGVVQCKGDLDADAGDAEVELAVGVSEVDASARDGQSGGTPVEAC